MRRRRGLVAGSSSVTTVEFCRKIDQRDEGENGGYYLRDFSLVSLFINLIKYYDKS